MKVVAGSNGYNVDALAMLVRPLLIEGKVPTVEAAAMAAVQANFGGPANLVVVNDHEIFCESGYDPNPLYRRTFHDPQFNPRWRRGTVDNLVILEINECCEQPERRRITRKIERRKIRNVSSVALHATIRNLAMRYGWSIDEINSMTPNQHRMLVDAANSQHDGEL